MEGQALTETLLLRLLLLLSLPLQPSLGLSMVIVQLFESCTAILPRHDHWLPHWLDIEALVKGIKNVVESSRALRNGLSMQRGLRHCQGRCRLVGKL